MPNVASGRRGTTPACWRRPPDRVRPAPGDTDVFRLGSLAPDWNIPVTDSYSTTPPGSLLTRSVKSTGERARLFMVRTRAMLHDENYKRQFASPLMVQDVLRACLPAHPPAGRRRPLPPGQALRRVHQRRTAHAPRRHRQAARHSTPRPRGLEARIGRFCPFAVGAVWFS